MSKLSTLTVLLIFIISFSSSGQSLEWVYQAPGANAGTCTSTTDCDAENVCFGIVYTPGVTGTATSYTLGFQVDCPNGTPPAIAASSCTMTDNTAVSAGCFGGIFLLQPSGNNGGLAVTAGVPVILHQVCIQVGADRLDVIEDDITGLTVSVDQTVGGPTTEVLSFDPFVADATECGVTFPVSWTHFTARKAGKTAALDWGTSREEAHDYFSVEHAADGRSFNAIGTVTAARTEVNGVRNYRFTHETPVVGTNFYRIRQVDIDGTTSYSAIRTVTFAENAGVGFALYPNPVSELLTLEFGADDGPVEVQVLTTDGRLLLTGAPPPGATTMNIGTRELPAGVYIVRVNNASRRFIKQR